MKHYCIVVVIQEGVISEDHLIIGTDEQKVGADAEAKFLEVCRRHIWNFDEYSQDDIDAILEDGYAMFGRGAVCISWPAVSDN